MGEKPRLTTINRFNTTQGYREGSGRQLPTTLRPADTPGELAELPRSAQSLRHGTTILARSFCGGKFWPVPDITVMKEYR